MPYPPRSGRVRRRTLALLSWRARRSRWRALSIKLHVHYEVRLIRAIGVAVDIFEALEFPESIRERWNRPGSFAFLTVLVLQPWLRLGERLVTQARRHHHASNAFTQEHKVIFREFWTF